MKLLQAYEKFFLAMTSSGTCCLQKLSLFDAAVSKIHSCLSIPEEFKRVSLVFWGNLHRVAENEAKIPIHRSRRYCSPPQDCTQYLLHELIKHIYSVIFYHNC